MKLPHLFHSWHFQTADVRFLYDPSKAVRVPIRTCRKCDKRQWFLFDDPKRHTRGVWMDFKVGDRVVAVQ